LSRLLMVRHGDTELNSAERLWGRTDVKLDALGFKQAARLCERLAEEKIDVIYSSSLKRALVTAETIAAKHQLKVISCTELREVDFGDLEGLTISEVDQRYPEVTELRIKRSLEMKYPGGDSFLLGKQCSLWLIAECYVFFFAGYWIWICVTCGSFTLIWLLLVY